MAELVRMFTTGQSIIIKVVFPEGKNLYQVAEILAGRKVIRDKERFISLCKDADFLKKLAIQGKTCEGRLYPDTYYFTPQTREEDVIKRFYSVFKEKIRQLDFSLTKLTPYEVIILASIVEKETGASCERPVIAGVFHNRLKKGMRLQSDPTTIYGIWERYKGNITKADLQRKTPYNTYRITGLPIGPIANPGLEAMEAVLRPAKHSYLYFVSKNDGTHVFSKNYKDHSKAVTQYQKRSSARKGKSWRDLKGDCQAIL